MNLKQFKYVIVLAEAGSFSGAADILGISQPSLSQYIKKIEEQTGIDLFERTGGSVRLTDAGRVYVDIGRKILELEHQMQNRLVDICENKTGSLIVGTSPFRSASLMPEVAVLFKNKYPGIELIVREMESRELIEAAERGEFDLCITNLPIDRHVFDYEIIAEEEMLVAVKAGSKTDSMLCGNCDKERNTVDVSILNGVDFVMLTENQVMQKALCGICADFGIEIKTAVVVKSIEAQIEMVRNGLGAALVPAGIRKLRGVESGVNYYCLSQELPKRKLAVMYRKEKYLSEPVRDMIGIIKSLEF